MILQQLYTDSDAILGKDKPPAMYDWRAVKWIVDVSENGQFIGITPIGDKYGLPHMLPYNYGRSSDIVANLLADTADYALGANAAPEDKNAPKKHTAFRAMLAQCAEASDNPQVRAIIQFLDAGGVTAEQAQQSGIQPKERVVFTVEGQWPTEAPEVQAFWDDLTNRECKGVPKQQGECLITGRVAFVESVLPCDISIARESAPIISVNDKAANSYGFEQAYNGAVSRDAAEGFTKALNALMRGDRSHFRVTLNRDGSEEMVYVFWTPHGEEPDIYEAVAEPPDPQFVQKLLRSALDGRRVDDTRNNAEQFFALAITGNKTRVVFRDWLATTLPEVKQRLRSWFLAQRLMDHAGETKYFSVRDLASALYRRDSKGKLLEKIAPRVVRALLYSALHGEAVPREILSRVVLRCRAEHHITTKRAVVLKMALTLNNEKEAEKLATLDLENSDPPYVCGRLLALLDSIQYQAQGNVNSSVIDRYFSAAATTPGRIFPLLVRKAEGAHLSKIKRQKRGVFYSLETELQDMHSLLPAMSYPLSLTLEEQARFMLGFYHQKVYISHRIAAAKERKAATSDAATPANNEETNEND